MRTLAVLGALVHFMVSGCASGEEPDVDLDLSDIPDVVSYNFDVRPILSDSCFACHGPDRNSVYGDLQLHTEEGLFSPRGEASPWWNVFKRDRFAVVPGHPDRSELFQRIVANDPEYMMPPPESNLELTDRDVAIIKRWIEQGGEWEPHWAFIVPEKSDLPYVASEEWPENPIDYFVLGALEDRNITPAPEAGREEWLRRVTFDLTGLPPTVEEIDQFLDDHSANAYEKVVDRLLASTAYGERLGNEWLDVARYADSHGYELDNPNHMWPWRDWVVDAFNRNMPFDQFTTWQIAGDLLPEATREQRLATGFGRVHMQNQEGGIIDEEFRVQYVKDRVNTTGSAFLGLTMECASCHDHKFDPVTEDEYYQMAAFFNSINETMGRIPTRVASGPTILLPDSTADRQIAWLEQRIEEMEQGLDNLATEKESEFNRWEEQLLPAPDPNSLLPDTVGLIVHLTLDEIPEQDEEAVDEEGNSLPELINEVDGSPIGRISGSPEEVDGVRGGALELSSGNRFHLGGVGDFNRDDRFTFAFWINSSDTLTGDVPVFHKADNVAFGYNGYDVALLDDRISVRLIHGWSFNAIQVKTSESLPLNEWSHVTITYDGSSKAAGIDIYVDGHRQQTEIIHDNLYKNIRLDEQNPNFSFGRRAFAQALSPGDFERLKLDDFRIYNRRLSSAEALVLADPHELSRMLAASPEERDDYQRQILFNHYLSSENSDYSALLESLAESRTEMRLLTDSLPEVMVMQDRIHPRETFILERGEYNSHGKKVEAGTPSSVLDFPDDLPKNRLGLAQWLVSRENPLTARVTVNRYWQMIFGKGLVDTPADFGNQGSLPSHPELLDWLAVNFMEEGWDVQELLKQMVLSSTYRQTSVLTADRLEQDPENRLLSRGPRTRLTAEMIRDNAIYMSGLLVDKTGGPPVFPYQPEGLWPRSNPDYFFGLYEQDEGESLYRRSIYTVFKRNQPPPSMLIFDHPVRSEHTIERATTSTPLQALVTWNDPQLVEASRMMAERMIEEGGETIQDQITYLFRAATTRNPVEEEMELLLNSYEEQLDFYNEYPEEAGELLAVGEYPANRDLPATEVAARTMVVSTVLNLHETLSK